ncbi:hypothetical protein [Polynucleobacter sp. MWH-UH25E]|uniref:hypothetical protein n=1 Tax=Polynucleobacter sp. MWH-UH25E TaxID=1855616 RepID=UPI001BFD8FE6|nr:hypothetical protein [Polynucleobacter sp. MWH-UH25E]QWD62817.1 hypothetical protein ICV39_04195 [Polynucleobacter sp. MWH-UH25E]
MEALLNEAIEVKVSSATSANDAANPEAIKKQTVLHYSVEALNAMEAARIHWEQGSFRKSNEELGSVLQECKAFCGELPAPAAKQRAIALANFYKERGYRYNKEAPLETRVLRAVFGMDNRRRVSSYSIVLREAKKQNVSILDLPTWIASKGGVQEIRLSQSKTFIPPKAKAEEMSAILDGRSFIGYAESALLSHTADAEYAGDKVVLLGKQTPEGKYGIYTVLRSDGIVNAALLATYAKSKEIEAKAKKEIEAANDADGKPVAA